MESNSSRQSAILIVEDHRETRTFLELALADEYTVDCATDASEALEMTDQTDYDLLLVDIALRDSMDGTELVERLRQRPDYSDVPFVGMTAHKLREDRQYYLQRGFDEFLNKPFFPEDLLETIAELLGKGRGDRDRPR